MPDNEDNKKVLSYKNYKKVLSYKDDKDNKKVLSYKDNRKALSYKDNKNNKTVLSCAGAGGWRKVVLKF